MFKVTKKLLFATSPQLLYSLVVIQIYSILVCYPEEESEMSSDINAALKKTVHEGECSTIYTLQVVIAFGSLGKMYVCIFCK